MRELFVGTRYKFMARRKLCYALSILLCVISTISLIAHGGPRKSVDFTGGNVLTVAFDKAASVDDVRDAVAKEHIPKGALADVKEDPHHDETELTYDIPELSAS